MDFSLTKLPWYAQVGAFVLLAAAAVVVFEVYYESPADQEIAVRQQQLVALRADVAKGRDTARKLPQFRTQVADLEARLDNLKAILPDEKDAADLLRRMQTVA